MKNTIVAERYAKAMFIICKQKNIQDKAMTELTELLQAITKDIATKDYFESPLVSPAQKKEVIEKALAGKGYIEEVLSMATLMAEKNRLMLFADVVKAYKGQLNESAGVTEGTVRARQPLSLSTSQELEKIISQVIKKKITLTYKEDATVIGGAIAQVGGWTFDASLETQLKKMNEELKRRSN
jgi:F-type H+-transporting ATPase subunit delta